MFDINVIRRGGTEGLVKVEWKATVNGELKIYCIFGTWCSLCVHSKHHFLMQVIWQE